MTKSKMLRLSSVLEILFGCGLFFATSLSQAVETSGHLKLYSIYRKPRLAALQEAWQQSVFGRLDLGESLNDKLSFLAAAELGVFSHLQPRLSRAYRLSDPSSSAGLDTDKVQLNLDRLQLLYESSKQTLLVGRQAIWFGTGRIANPTDVFVPIPFVGIVPEHRSGVDAVRWTYYWGQLSEFELGYLLGDSAKPSESASFARLKTNIKNYDVELITILFHEAWLGGLNLNGEIGGVGLWTELARVVHEDGSYWQWNLGAEALLFEEWRFFVEYHHNGAGTSSPQEWDTQSFAYRYGGTFFRGQSIAAFGLGRTLSPLLSLNTSLLRQNHDASLLAQLALTYSLGDDLLLDVSGLFGASPGSVDLEEGEFSAVGSVLWANLRYYF